MLTYLDQCQNRCGFYSGNFFSLAQTLNGSSFENFETSLNETVTMTEDSATSYDANGKVMTPSSIVSLDQFLLSKLKHLSIEFWILEPRNFKNVFLKIYKSGSEIIQLKGSGSDIIFKGMGQTPLTFSGFR